MSKLITNEKILNEAAEAHVVKYLGISKDEVGEFATDVNLFVLGATYERARTSQLIADIKYSLSNPLCSHKVNGSTSDNASILESIRELLISYESDITNAK